MTARVAPKRKSAREGLLDFFACMCLAANDDERAAVRVFRRLLRAHERDIAERAVAWSREVNRPQHVDIATAIRAAILAPQAKRGRVR